MPGFCVDLDRLNNVAVADLPDVIDAVIGTMAQLGSIATDQTAAFDGDLYHDRAPYSDTDTPMTGPPGLAEDVDRLREQLVAGLSQLADNLEQSRTAVHEIANRYRVADCQPPYPTLGGNGPGEVGRAR